jgi:hypothetical protein
VPGYNHDMENVSIETNMSQESSGTRHPRRWFSFSLRTLLIFFVVVAALLHFWVIPSERQRRACEQIRNEGGYYSFHANHHVPDAWYVFYCENVAEIHLHQPSDVNDWSIFPKLKTLRLRGEWDFKKVLQDKSHIRNLVSIDMNMNSFVALSDENIEILSHYRKLRLLDVSACYITPSEKAINQISTFPQLIDLRLMFSEPRPTDSNYENVRQAIKDLQEKILHCNIDLHLRRVRIPQLPEVM